MSSETATYLGSKDDNSTPTTPSQKRRARKRERDANAPVQPANCYTRFMKQRRPQLVQEHPELSHIEITKRVGEEWKALSAKEKEVYMNTASAERREYLKELSVYKKTESYKLFRKKMKKNIESGLYQETEIFSLETPIFSKEFLELNRQRESELRRLRIENVRLEEEQVALESNLARLKKATDQLELDMKLQHDLTTNVRSQLDDYRCALVQAFSHMPLPGTNVVPTLATIDTYMNNIHKLVLEAPGEHQDFVAKVRDIVTKLKLPAPSL